MTDIIEDYLRDVETRLQGTDDQKRAIIRELRSHLWEKVDALAAEQPDRPRDDVAREVIHDFGSPQDLALAYSPAGTPVLKRATTGETVLGVGRSVGRGMGKFVKGLAVGLAIVLVLAAGAGVWAYYEFKPLVAANAPYPVYSHEEYCGTNPCSSDLVTAQFALYPEARETRFELDLRHAEDSNGSVTILVADPTGSTWRPTRPSPPPGASSSRRP